jgi:hypothetical protein
MVWVITVAVVLIIACVPLLGSDLEDEEYDGPVDKHIIREMVLDEEF